jgi:hypothetical protein
LKTADTDLAVNGTIASLLNAIFRGCTALERVKSLTIFPEAVLKNSFDECVNLVDITIAGTIGQTVDFHWSTKLSADSIRSIIWALSETATGKAITLSETAVNNAFASDMGEWTDYLSAIRSNWTINLV